MKNVTEFPGFLLRRAHAVRKEAFQALKAALPTQTEPEEASDTVVTSAEESPTEAATPAGEEAKEASSEAPSEDSAEAEKASADAKNDSESDKTEAESEKAPAVDEEALAKAVGEALKVSEERLEYLMGALKAIGRKGIEKVRQVRVFKGEEGPSGAFSIGELHFVVDRMAALKKSSPDSKGRGRDNKGRDGKGRGRDNKGGRGFDSMARDEKPGDVPSGGLGWSLERAPGSEKKEGRGGRGKPRRKGPKRGKPGDKPGENRNRGRGRGKKPPMPEVVVKATTVAPSEKK